MARRDAKFMNSPMAQAAFKMLYDAGMLGPHVVCKIYVVPSGQHLQKDIDRNAARTSTEGTEATYKAKAEKAQQDLDAYKKGLGLV